MDTVWLSRTPAGENSASTATRGPNWLLMRIKSVCSKEVRRGVINRNCFIMFWRLTFNGPGLCFFSIFFFCFLCLDNCQKSDGVRLLITLVLLQPKCSENRFTVRLASPQATWTNTGTVFVKKISTASSHPTYLFRVVNLYPDFQYGSYTVYNVFKNIIQSDGKYKSLKQLAE